MRQRVAQSWTRLIGLAFAVLGMASLGMAHPAVQQTAASAELAAYALPDGSLPELCGAGGHEQPTPDEGSHTACLAACVLATPAVLPVATIVAQAPMAVHERPSLPAAAPASSRPLWATAQARAPPTA